MNVWRRSWTKDLVETYRAPDDAAVAEGEAGRE